MANPPVTAQLTMDIADKYLSEQGHAIELTSPKSWASRKQATVGIYFEKFTEILLLEPKRNFADYADAQLADWTLSGDAADWRLVSNVSAFDYEPGIFHKITAVTRRTAERVSNWAYNPSCMIAFYLYHPNVASPYLDLTFGVTGGDPTGNLTLRLEAGKHPTILFDTDSDGQQTYEIFQVPPIASENLYLRKNRLWILFLRETIVVESNFMPPFSWRPPRSVRAQVTWNDGTFDHVYLVPTGKFRLSACGMFYFVANQLKYLTTGTYYVPFTLPYTPTQAHSSSIDWEAFPGTTAGLTIRKADDSDQFAVGDSAGLAKVQLTGDTASPFVNSISVKWPVLAGDRGGDNKTPPVLEVREHRSWRADSDLLTALCLDDGTYSNLQRQVNMKLSLSLNGTQRFTGYVDEPFKTWEGDRKYFSINARDTMRKIQNAMLEHDMVGDGQYLVDVFKDAVKHAGFVDAQIDIDSSAIILPTSGNAQEPAYLFPVGTPIMAILRYFADVWLPTWRLYSKLNGDIAFKEWVQGESLMTFLAATDAGAADPSRVMLELEEHSDDADLRNHICVFTMDMDGNAKRAIQEDVTSWTTPGSANYVGERRPFVYADASLLTQSAVDTVALALFNELCRVRRYYTWRAKLYEELEIGDVVTLEGHGLVKLTQMDVRAMKRLAICNYAAEWIGEA